MEIFPHRTLNSPCSRFPGTCMLVHMSMLAGFFHTVPHMCFLYVTRKGVKMTPFMIYLSDAMWVKRKML